MGVNLPKDITLAGFRLSKVKQALTAYARTGQAENFLQVETLAPSRMEAAALYEELLERRFIDPDGSYEHFLTEAGLAIAGGKMRRSPLGSARRVLDDLLTRVEKMNEHLAPLNVVERVWLFGSAMRGEETVGDIDLAIEAAPNPVFGQGAARSDRLSELVHQAPRHLPYFRKLSWHEEWCIFGERRHPLLAGANIGSDELQRLGVPCRLVFDRGRGGRVNDEMLSRHPDSPGRSNEMTPPRELPDLAPIDAVPAPMDARWMSSYSTDGRVYPRRLTPHDTRVPGSGSFVLADHTSSAGTTGFQM